MEEVFKIYYKEVNSFEEDLKGFGEFLESLDKARETIIAVVPNIGNPLFSFSLGGGSHMPTKVKGLAVIVKKN